MIKKDEFDEQNSKDWQKIHQSILGDEIQKKKVWTDINEIISVLNIIGNIESSNHMFFPDGGGLDLEGASKSHEKGCIELNTGITYIVKPKSLTFEPSSDGLEWNYFRLEIEELEPSEIYDGITKEDYSEEVTELSPGHYVDRSYWDEGEYEDKKLPATARPLARYFKGSFVIFKKSSIYNKNSATYDARHEKLGAVGFKKHIEEAIESLSK